LGASGEEDGGYGKAGAEANRREKEEGTAAETIDSLRSVGFALQERRGEERRGKLTNSGIQLPTRYVRLVQPPKIKDIFLVKPMVFWYTVLWSVLPWGSVHKATHRQEHNN
jgi:hypothetical protein